MKKILPVVILLFISSVCFSQLTTSDGLLYYYDILNWTQVPGTGSIDISDAPNSIVFTSGDSGDADSTYIEIKAPAPGVVTFEWAYTTSDGAQYDFPFYIIDGVITPFNSYDTGGASSQSGTETFTVEAAQMFGFGAYTSDGLFGSCTINTFSFLLPSVPIGITTILSVFGLSGIAILLRRRKKRI
ncbi:MAG: hypothetical protein PF541_12265 [Prolixibacteraceae bacterium]|jgi:hypothetical protein|nr:hypothetical protein [Prolixibacteraceae bacterium]